MWNLKSDANELTKKTESDIESKLKVTKGGRGVRLTDKHYYI